MLAAIKQIVNPDVVLGIDTQAGQLTLKETAADSKLKKLHINGIPQSAFAFTLDYQPKDRSQKYFQQLSLYVDKSNSMGINKGCDLILVWCEDGSLRVLIFDLKSTKPNLEDTGRQLLNSELYVRYLLSMVKNYYGVTVSSVNIKKAIVNVARGSRKQAAYPVNQNSQAQQPYDYRIKLVKPHKNQEAYVQFGALVQ